MESHYDREVGVAWGPITPEEILDDILLRRNESVPHRRTISALPSFSDRNQRLCDVIENDEETLSPILDFFPNMNLNSDSDVLVISSDDESEEICEKDKVESQAQILNINTLTEDLTQESYTIKEYSEREAEDLGILEVKPTLSKEDDVVFIDSEPDILASEIMSDENNESQASDNFGENEINNSDKVLFPDPLACDIQNEDSETDINASEIMSDENNVSQASDNFGENEINYSDKVLFPDPLPCDIQNKDSETDINDIRNKSATYPKEIEPYEIYNNHDKDKNDILCLEVKSTPSKEEDAVYTDSEYEILTAEIMLEEENVSDVSDVFSENEINYSKMGNRVSLPDPLACDIQNEDSETEITYPDIIGNKSASSTKENDPYENYSNHDQDRNDMYLGIENRLPTPANLDEDMYDEISLLMPLNNCLEEEISHQSNVIHEKQDDNKYSGLENRLPTPANLDEDTYDEICEDYSDSEKEEEISPDIQEEKIDTPLRKMTEECSLDNDRHIFNDTLEEMERLLNEGLNYSMKSDSTKPDVDNLSVKEHIFPVQNVNQLETNTPNPKLPLNEIIPINITKASPSQSRGAISKKPMKMYSKIPTVPSQIRQNLNKPFVKPTSTPNSKQILTPNQTASKNRFKNIESPISVYIKNSGKTPLYKKVTPGKSLSCDRIKPTVCNRSNKENSILFPEVIYKPAKKTIITKEAGCNLPKKIDSLVPQKPQIIRHQGRIGGTKNKNTSISRKLLDEDLTLNSNTSLNTTTDISLLYQKKAYIT